jgi:uncharacterized membrane protein/uncharacterized RDD family membrane protein YckC
MVDPVTLASDIAGNTAFLALPAVLWLFLYLWAWERPAVARTAGFGRRIFWLLLPGCLLASAADAPILLWNSSVLAMNLGGALIPIVLSVYLPSRWYGTQGYRPIALAIALLAAMTAGLFTLVLIPSESGYAGLGAFHGTGIARVLDPLPIVLAFALVVALVWAIAAFWTARELSMPHPPSRAPDGSLLTSPVFYFLALASFALLLTYATTQAIPGLGIVSGFPQYLAPPVLTGILAVLAVRPALGLPRIAGLAFGYSAGTFGALVGADVLHQPPLYGGPPGVLAIGGAGILDLVYLTGLLAVAAGFLTWMVLARLSPRPDDAFVLPEPQASPAPRIALAEAERRFARGDLAGAVAGALRACEDALSRVRRLSGLPPAGPEENPFTGLGTPGYAAHDLQNLRALARQATPTPYDAQRALRTAAVILALASEIERPLFAPLSKRVPAFLVDFAIVTGPAVALWALIIRETPGGAVAVLSSVAYTAALLGYASAVFLYFAISEGLTGTTLGKTLFGLDVTDRELGRPGLIPTLVRNAPRALPAAIVFELGGVGLALLLAPGGTPANGLGLGLGNFEATLLLIAATLGFLLIGAISSATILLSPERARVGDLWAGTWVIPRRARAPSSMPAPLRVPVSPPVPAPLGRPPMPSGPGEW